MSHKNFGYKSSKPESHDEKKTTSSQHSKYLHVMVNKLDKQIDEMINELKNLKEYAWESASEFQRYKSLGKDFEKDIEYHYQSHQHWFEQIQLKQKDIQLKMKAIEQIKKEVRSPKKIENFKIKGKKDFMKYGPSDEEE